MKVIAYSSRAVDGRVVISESPTGELCQATDIEQILEFLITPFEGDYVKLVWELADFTAPIFRLLSAEAIEKLAKTRKVRVGNYGIFYVPEKVLAVTFGRWKVNIFELQQYFPDKTDPGDSAQVAANGEAFLDQLKGIGFHLRGEDKLTSPAAVMEEWLLNRLDLPRDTDIPEGQDAINAYAYQCCGRLWISANKLGHWRKGEVWDYDLSGAFAYEASQLYDFRGARIDYSQSPVIGAHWGFLRGRVSIDCPVSPIMRRLEDGSLANPVGEWDDIITLDEARFISKYKIGHFKMRDGWFITQNKFSKPLETVISRLYQARKNNPQLDLFLKRGMLGSLYGKFIEMHSDGPGRHFCPIYAATISTRARLKVGAFILENNLANDLVHCSVDGLLATKKIDLPPAQGLGKWRIDEPEGVIVASSGQVFKKTHSRMTKPKGITYDDLVRMIAEHPRRSYYGIEIPRRVTLSEAAGGHYDELGAIRNFHSSIDFILQDHRDRQFTKLPKTGENLLNRVYESEPIELKD